MKWIEKILINHNVANIEMIMEEVKKAYPKHSIPKEKYNIISKKIKELRMENCLLNKLSQAGVKDTEYAVYKIKNTNTAKEDEINGWEEAIKEFKKAYPEQFNKEALADRKVIEVVRTIYDNS